MALQQIDWLQINTKNIPLDPTGSKALIVLGNSGSNQLEAVYARNLFISGIPIDDYVNSGSQFSGIFQQTGSYYATTNDLQITGSVKIVGDLLVEGTTTLVQKLDPNVESLIVSGAMSIVKTEISSQIVSASLTIENLGTLGDRQGNYIIDCGDGFF
jgi:hypothetical protein